MKKTLLLMVLFIWAFNTQGQSKADCPGEFEDYEEYDLCYCEQWEQPYWVSYTLEEQEIYLPSQKRLSRFLVDDNISTGSATHDDYTHSGYDRGHLSRAMYNKKTREIYRQSYYMSNISPQLPGFNRRGGRWYALEELEISLSKRYDKVLSFSGPWIVDLEGKSIGENEVVIPQFFYKAIYIPEVNVGMVFFLDHTDVEDDRPLSDQLMTVDDFESMTGIDFFTDISDDSFEKKVPDWFFEEVLMAERK